MNEELKSSSSEEQKQTHNKPSSLDHYGSQKWLLPLLVFIGILLLLLSVFAFMESRDTDNNSMENSKKQMEKDDKQKVMKRRNAKKKQKRNQKNNGGNARAIANSEWTNFTYTYNEKKVSLKYPSNMKINITNQESDLDGVNTTPFISFQTNDPDLQNLNFFLSFERNLNNLSANQWLLELSKKNNTSCQIVECKAFAQPFETITIAGRQAIFQEFTTYMPMVNAYIPFDNSSILWIRANTLSGDNLTDGQKTLFKEILGTISY